MIYYNLLTLLMICIALGMTAPPKPNQKPFSTPITGNKMDFLKDVNNLRRQYSKLYNIPNMHEMRWSEDLENIVKFIEIDDYKWRYKKGPWRYAVLGDYDYLTEKLERDFTRFIEGYPMYREEQYGVDGAMSTLGLIAPLQRIVGCEPKQDEYTAYVVCLMAFQSEFEIWDVDSNSTDVPGSNCTVGYENNDGLCSPMEATDISYFGSKEAFLNGLNELRREYAVDKKFGNMYELTWNEQLSEIAQTMDYDSNSTNSNFRTVKISKYRGTVDTIKTTTDEYLEKDEDSRKAFLEDTNSLKRDLEFIAPRQQLIGCGPQYYLEDPFILCLVGPQNELKLDSNSDEVTSSECDPKFKKDSDSGMCVPLDPTQLSHVGYPEEFLEKIWNEDLAKTAKALDFSSQSNWTDLNIKYRSTVIPNYRIPIEDQSYSNPELQEFLSPTQKRGFCQGSQRHPTTIWSEDLAQIMDSTNYSLLEDYSNPRRRTVILESYYGIKNLMGNQLLELSGNFELFDFQGQQVPGSECSRGFENDGGYCVPRNLDTVTYLGVPEVFVENLNDLRRELAGNYSIPDMYELIWSPELVEISKNLEESELPTSAYKTWRFTWIQNYEGQKSPIFESLQKLLAKTDTEKSDFFMENSEDKGLLEFINPSQKQLGCVIKDHTEWPIVCILGDEKDFKLWNFERKSDSVAGSQCSSGYENFNGLCVLEGSKDSEKTTTTVKNTTTNPPTPSHPPPTQKSLSESPEESQNSEENQKSQNPQNPQNPEKQTSESEKPKVHYDEEKPLEESKPHNSNSIFSLLVFFMISVRFGF